MTKKNIYTKIKLNVGGVEMATYKCTYNDKHGYRQSKNVSANTESEAIAKCYESSNNVKQVLGCRKI